MVTPSPAAGAPPRTKVSYEIAGFPPFVFEEDEAVALWTRNRGLRRDILDALAGRGRRRARIRIGEDYLDGEKVTCLRQLTGICRTPPVWLPRESILESFNLIYRMRGQSPDAAGIERALSSVGYFDWPARPSLGAFPDRVNENYARVLALARLLLVPYRIYLIDNPLHGQADERQELLFGALLELRKRPGIKIFLADRPEHIPSFWSDAPREIPHPHHGATLQ